MDFVICISACQSDTPEVGSGHSGGLGRFKEEVASASAWMFRNSSHVGGPMSLSECPFTCEVVIVVWWVLYISSSVDSISSWTSMSERETDFGERLAPWLYESIRDT